jgi:hypothetical protein
VGRNLPRLQKSSFRPSFSLSDPKSVAREAK